MLQTELTEGFLDRLEGAARRATPGPWLADAHWGFPWEVGTIGYPEGYWDTDEVTARVMIASTDVRQGNTDEAPRGTEVDFDGCCADAWYIAAASPDVVLALVAEVRALRKRLRHERNERNEISPPGGARTRLTSSRPSDERNERNEKSPRAEDPAD